MMRNRDAFHEQLRETFKLEAAERLQEIANGLLEIENAPSNIIRAPAIEGVFRAAHSLKGAARAVEFVEVESLCEPLEELFSAWKRGHGLVLPSDFDAAHHLLNGIASELAGSSEPDATPPTVASTIHASTASPENASQIKREPSAIADATSKVAFGSKGIGNTVRVPVSVIDAHLAETEELLIAKLVTARHAAGLRELAVRFDDYWRTWATIEAAMRATELARSGRAAASEAPSPNDWERLKDLLEWSRDYLKDIGNRMASLARSATHDQVAVGKLVDDLMEGARSLRRLPFSSLSTGFPKVVRDLCHSQNKEADLTIRGGDVEFDRVILDELKDPLIHLLRNSIDHGVATPADRVSQGKPPRASIALSASRIVGGTMEVVLVDDGVGIDPSLVRASAVRQGAISVEDAASLSDAEARALIFRSAVSTSDTVNRVSGRGLGLAIVREKVEALGGEVTVDSQVGVGTRFRIVVPTVRASMRGVVMRVKDQIFVVLATLVDRVMRVKRSDIRSVEARHTIILDGYAVPLLSLAHVLEMRAAPMEPIFAGGTVVEIIVLGDGDNRTAFAVDAILGEQLMLLKRFKKPLERMRNVAAAAVLSSGQLVPVLHVFDLLQSAHNGATPFVFDDTQPQSPAQPVVQSILVAEDSITTRMLIKNILEAAGYRVETAVDGLDAFARLRSEHFDLVVSDVEMPRLNGFDLTTQIRADRRLSEIPVVLVTALETAEDRIRGIDAGANAYLSKDGFDQLKLLETVRDLVGLVTTR